MSVKSFFAKIFANIVVMQSQKWMIRPQQTQDKWLSHLVLRARNTQFGKEHLFFSIKSHADFVKRVPIRDYEELRSYMDKVVQGEPNVLWPGKPLYLAKTSGTTSGAKFIPLTKDSIPFHIKGARNAILFYIQETKKAKVVDGKMIFLQGSPILEEKNGVKFGRLSGIVAHYVPKYLQKNRMPSWETNCIEDWETKIDKIVEETIDQNMTLISGIPPWLVMYFERLIEKSGKSSIIEIFPNLQLMVTGGVNYNPYKEKIDHLIGKKLDVIQTYPASEGFLAYQNSLNSDDLLLLLDNGIFYEFIETDKFFDENPERISDRKSTRLNSSHVRISYAVFCLKKKK